MGGSSSSMDRAPPPPEDYRNYQNSYPPRQQYYQDDRGQQQSSSYYDTRNYSRDEYGQNSYYQQHQYPSQPPPPLQMHTYTRQHSYASSRTSTDRCFSQLPKSPPRPAPDDDRFLSQNSKPRRTYSKIGDEYGSLDEVVVALQEAGLESSNLIVGVDFTKSNEWTGKQSFNRQCLHRVGGKEEQLNPYEQAISIIGSTLASYDEDDLIPCFGFGDASSHDHGVFSFYPDGRPCHGFEEVLDRYRKMAPTLKLAGPTSFAPIIETAITIVQNSGGQYHMLLIIADGQVTTSLNTDVAYYSAQAIIRASDYPLSIVLVGVGDGPWDTVKEFYDNISNRKFDNFQFVNLTDIMAKKVPYAEKEKHFSLATLMKVPAQYKATMYPAIPRQSKEAFSKRRPLRTPCNQDNLPGDAKTNSGGNSVIKIQEQLLEDRNRLWDLQLKLALFLGALDMASFATVTKISGPVKSIGLVYASMGIHALVLLSVFICVGLIAFSITKAEDGKAPRESPWVWRLLALGGVCFWMVFCLSVVASLPK